MRIKPYIGNALLENTTQACHGHCATKSTKVTAKSVTEKYSDWSQESGFVERPTQKEGRKMINALAGTD